MDTRRQTNYDHKIALIDMKVLNHKCWAQNKTFGNWVSYNVTRLGILLDFGQLFKAFGNN